MIRISILKYPHQWYKNPEDKSESERNDTEDHKHCPEWFRNKTADLRPYEPKDKEYADKDYAHPYKMTPRSYIRHRRRWGTDSHKVQKRIHYTFNYLFYILPPPVSVPVMFISDTVVFPITDNVVSMVTAPLN